MSTVVHREFMHVFRPVSNVNIITPLICNDDLHIIPAGQTVPVMTLGANGVVRVAHIDTETITVRNPGDPED